MAKCFYEAAAQLPGFLSGLLLKLDPQQAEVTTEIRLRSERPVALTQPHQSLYLTAGGGLTPQPQGGLTLTRTQLRECYLTLCNYSVASYEREIAQGFFTLNGGHRVGLAGSAVVGEDGKIQQIKDPTSLCIRIARTPQLKLPPQLTALLQGIQQQGLLLAGEPASGKTTLLRGCCTALSQQGGLRSCVVDERREIWPVTGHGFTQPPPCQCDLLSGYPKHLGILQALRSLSPQVILCDEVGSEADAQAVAAGANAGVGMVVTIHARREEELYRRPQAKRMLATGAFGWVAFLAGADRPGQLREVRRVSPVP